MKSRAENLLAENNPFRKPSYKKWFFADSFLALSTSTTLATSLLLLDLSENPARTGVIVGIINGLGLGAVIFGGGLADLTSRRKLLNFTIAASLIANTIIFSFIIFDIPSDKNLDILPIIIGLLIISEISLSFANPSLDGSLKNIITPTEYPRAMSAAQARSSTLSIVGSPLTGWVYGILAFIPFILRSIFECIFLVLLRKVPENLGPSSQANHSSKNTISLVYKSLYGYKEGIKFLISEKALLRIVICAPLVNMMVFYAMNWTIYSLRVENSTASNIGFIIAGFAVGGILGSLITPFMTDRFPPGKLAIGGLGTMVILFAIYLFMEHSNISMFLFSAICMIPSPSLNAGLFSYVFQVTDENLQGRVIASFTLVAGLATVLAPLSAGWAVGHQFTVPVGVGVCCLGAFGVMLLASSSEVRNMAFTK